MNAGPRFCSNCGSPLNPGARFCSRCGSPVQPPAAPPPRAQQPPQYAPPYPGPPPAHPAYAQPAEPIIGIVTGLQRRAGALGLKTDNFNLVVTPGRLIFAAMSQQLMNQAVATARSEAKGQGKGFFGQVAAQMSWLGVVCREYESMPVDAILTRYPGSFFIPNNQIRKIKLRAGYTDNDGQQLSKPEMVVEAASGKHKFTLVTMSPGEAKRILKQTLGGIVR
ncbi:MAG: zinc ribbon domain-containing protein [Anaerolineae bacterium]|nr:zinc ribbon domain-containing protein [Anaerolineae bacterium]